MSLEIDFESKEGYVHATVKGAFKKEDAIATFEKLLIYCTVTKTMKILLDSRGMEGELLVKDLLAFSQRSDGIQEDYGDSGMINEIRLAYLFDPSKYDINQISQGVFNPEKDDFMFTYEIKEAVDWLNSQ